MLTSAQRQSQIKAALSQSEAPQTANHFAKLFQVSRQTIVGDIALMRAQGETIVATPQGYEYEKPVNKQALIVCKHTPAQAKDEMRLVVENGGSLVDVIIDHPLYGQLRGSLQIRTLADVNMFDAKLRQHEGKLLSELTGGVHLHTIAYERPEQLDAIKAALKKAGYLVEQ